MKNFSVLVNNLGSSQLSFFLIKEINDLPELRPGIDGIVFYENLSSACLPTNFATMNISECWSHSGTTVATSLSTAKKLSSFPSQKKLFYVWDLEWIRNNNTKSYEEYIAVYTDESIELIARSKSHKEAIENAFNRNVNHVIPDFNLAKILEVI
jgi:hypothetical protein